MHFATGGGQRGIGCRGNWGRLKAMRINNIVVGRPLTLLEEADELRVCDASAKKSRLIFP